MILLKIRITNNPIQNIHTEKYSTKSYVVNFRTQISSSQSEERTMVFTREKIDTSNQNRERCFFTCKKNDTSNQRCVSFAPKFPPFIAACSTASHTLGSLSTRDLEDDAAVRSTKAWVGRRRSPAKFNLFKHRCFFDKTPPFSVPDTVLDLLCYGKF